MTIKTWKDEFYPVDASEVSSKRGAILHSIRKWKGLLPENMERHEVGHREDYLYNIVDGLGYYFAISTDSCALCTLYFDASKCVDCPLAQYLGKPCDRGENSPYASWLWKGDPEPMIMALEKTLFQTVRIEDK